MERKLATLRKISQILPIEGADAIELAIVDGWKVVVAKSVGHKPGDTVVYCEIDSFLPTEPEFEFLRKSSYKKMIDREGFRLKTIKLRGQISQGLIIPFQEASEIMKRRNGGVHPDYQIDSDLSPLLGIVKYEPPIPVELTGKVKGSFPGFVSKTDEERIQNLENFSSFALRSDHKFYATEKLEGTSSTFYVRDGEFSVCGRNLEFLETDTNSFWKVARELKLEEKLKSLNRNIALQGELIGEKVQGNYYKLKGLHVYFFSAFDIDNYKKLGFHEFQQLISDLELKSVPVIEDFVIPATVEEMLKVAEGKSQLNPQVEREGLVIRSYDSTISFKAISNKYLLGEK